jgi:pyroglutamyl-peptidase
LAHIHEKPLILVTGFEPFGGNTINPTELILKSLIKKYDSSKTYEFLLLPVDYERGPKVLIHQLRSKKYDAWLGLGQAGGRSKISLERVAINWKEKDFNLNSDENHFSPGPLIENSPAAFIHQGDLKNLKLKLIESSIPAEISLTAGSYVCNAVYYFAMKEQINSLFVHVPFIPEQKQAGQPTLTLEQEILATEILIKNIC